MKIRQKIIVNFFLLIIPAYFLVGYAIWRFFSISGEIPTEIIIIGLILFGFSIALVFYLSGLLVKPIGYLKNAIQNYKDGNSARLVLADEQENSDFSDLVKQLNSIIEEQEANKNIIQKREGELQVAQKQIGFLERQTSGEYFLVSLLLKPLIINSVNSGSIKIDFRINQHNKFYFQKSRGSGNISGEIGGDISIAHNVTLKNKNYVVFMNGDAIGKSLQGAQGALIAGIIFNEFITRTRVSVNQQNRFPEKWLRECYRAMQSAFVTFNFELMISAVIGLVDEKNGFVYYFNARHPGSVLYRNGKAKFLGDGNSLYKIGVEGLGDVFNLKTFQMLDSDALIFGSDGRDTILLKDENENTKMNEDENLFLECVEKGKGDLDKILQTIQKRGELTDDVTLLKVTYIKTPDPAELEKDNPTYIQFVERAKGFIKKRKYIEAVQKFEKAIKIYRAPEVYKDLLFCYRKLNDYEKQESTVREAYNQFPHVIEFSLHASELYKRLKRFETAIDHGERYRLYHPNDIKNLVNLADIYRLVKNYSRSRMILEEVEQIDNQHEGYLRMKSLLDKSESYHQQQS